MLTWNSSKRLYENRWNYHWYHRHSIVRSVKISFRRYAAFPSKSRTTTAVVTENIWHIYTGQVNEYCVQNYYWAEFQFQTKDGRSVTFEETNCGELNSPPNYQIGQKVDV